MKEYVVLKFRGSLVECCNHMTIFLNIKNHLTLYI